MIWKLELYVERLSYQRNGIKPHANAVLQELWKKNNKQTAFHWKKRCLLFDTEQDQDNYRLKYCSQKHWTIIVETIPRTMISRPVIEIINNLMHNQSTQNRIILRSYSTNYQNTYSDANKSEYFNISTHRPTALWIWSVLMIIPKWWIRNH